MGTRALHQGASTTTTELTALLVQVQLYRTHPTEAMEPAGGGFAEDGQIN